MIYHDDTDSYQNYDYVPGRLHHAFIFLEYPGISLGVL